MTARHGDDKVCGMGLINRRLRAQRALHGLTQEMTAVRARLTTNTVWKIENGHAKPTPAEQAKLARALKCEPADIFPVVGEQEEAAS